jgi:dienelactone hydrolase
MTRLLAVIMLLFATTVVQAEEPQSPWVRFNSLDGPQATVLDGYLFKPTTPGPHPAVVFLHGCGGLMVRGAIASREKQWAAALNAGGITVLMVDSFTPRGVKQMCAPTTFQQTVYAARTYDAYAALLYLQMQPDVTPDRIALMGWSEGGGVLLDTIRARSTARPPYLPEGDFRSAVGFYPARCNPHRQSLPWVSAVPLLVLIGDGDVWTPAAPCKELLDTAAPPKGLAEIVVYPGAYHDFDWPNMPLLRRPDYTTSAGIVPIQGTDPDARADAFRRVAEFFARTLLPPPPLMQTQGPVPLLPSPVTAK